jgi:hypothetical protein
LPLRVQLHLQWQRTCHHRSITPRLGVCRMRLFGELVLGKASLLENEKQNKANLISKVAVPVSENSVSSGVPQGGGCPSPHARVLLNPGVPGRFQNYRPIEQGQPIVPSQHQVHYYSPQKPYPNPAMQTQGGHAQYSNPAKVPTSPIGYGSPSPPSSSSSSSPHACGVCGATFTRPHDRKRHYESQHTTIEHVCQYCRKSYARVDSLKRHLDRPCDKMPQSAQKGT